MDANTARILDRSKRDRAAGSTVLFYVGLAFICFSMIGGAWLWSRQANSRRSAAQAAAADPRTVRLERVMQRILDGWDGTQLDREVLSGHRMMEKNARLVGEPAEADKIHQVALNYVEHLLTTGRIRD